MVQTHLILLLLLDLNCSNFYVISTGSVSYDATGIGLSGCLIVVWQGDGDDDGNASGRLMSS